MRISGDSEGLSTRGRRSSVRSCLSPQVPSVPNSLTAQRQCPACVKPASSAHFTNPASQPFASFPDPLLWLSFTSSASHPRGSSQGHLQLSWIRGTRLDAWRAARPGTSSDHAGGSTLSTHCRSLQDLQDHYKLLVCLFFYSKLERKRANECVRQSCCAGLCCVWAEMELCLTQHRRQRSVLSHSSSLFGSAPQAIPSSCPVISDTKPWKTAGTSW